MARKTVNRNKIPKKRKVLFFSALQPRVFDRSLHKANIWLKEIMEEMDWSDRERSFSAMRATLHALRDLLFLKETVHLGTQLPILFRGIYYEGWNPHLNPLRLKTINQFYQLVRLKLGSGQLKYNNEELRRLSRVCLNVICNHVDREVLPLVVREAG